MPEILGTDVRRCVAYVYRLNRSADYASARAAERPGAVTGFAWCDTGDEPPICM
jgi:hypothetical protein